MQPEIPKVAASPLPIVTSAVLTTPVCDAAASYANLPPSVVATSSEVISIVPPVPTPPQPPAAAEVSFAELAWKELEKPTSWVTISDWEDYKKKHGLSSFDELSFLGDDEIKELDSKLTTIPLKKFKKYMDEIK